MYQGSTTAALDGLVQLVLAPLCELGTPMIFFRVLVPSNPGPLVRKPPKLGSVSVAASENLDVPKKYHTSLGWLVTACPSSLM